MAEANTIITIGVSPAWDITCHVDNLEWGKHQKIISQEIIPAGKALNVSRALAWLGVNSIAAGLWGESDYQQMLARTAGLRKQVEISFTKAPGRTRQNLTLVEVSGNRETHLRAESKLAGRAALKNLKADLEAILTAKSICVLSGAMPDGDALAECLEIVEILKKTGAGVVIDTSGAALQTIVAGGGILLLKPNVEELRELLAEKIADETPALIAAMRKLSGRAKMILVSRGGDGAILSANHKAFTAKVKHNHFPSKNTVGCGDYLLAGFIAAWQESGDPRAALAAAIKVATAKAWGWTETMGWEEAEGKIVIETGEI